MNKNLVAVILIAVISSVVTVECATRVSVESVFSVRDFGARGDGKTLDTKAIQMALDKCGQVGGGLVRVPKGDYLIGAVFMKSNTTLKIEEGASLIGSDEETRDYPVLISRFNGMEDKCHASVINAIDVHDITITGKGLVSGSGVGGTRPPTGPRVIEFIRCKNVLLENIQVRNKGRWTIHPLYCTNVVIRGLDIRTTGKNADGIDPDSCRNVLITECTFDTGDDCIAIKSGKNQQGIDVGIPCENITVTKCTMLGGYGAICIGSEMSGDIRNVVIRDCVLRGVGTGFNIKSRRGRGGVVENVKISNIEMYGVNTPVAIYMNYRFNAGELIEGPAGIPTFRGITIEDLTIHGPRMGAIKGLPESPVTGLVLKNIQCEGSAVLALDHISGLVFDNIRNGDGSVALSLENVKLAE